MLGPVTNLGKTPQYVMDHWPTADLILSGAAKPKCPSQRCRAFAGHSICQSACALDLLQEWSIVHFRPRNRHQVPFSAVAGLDMLKLMTHLPLLARLFAQDWDMSTHSLLQAASRCAKMLILKMIWSEKPFPISSHKTGCRRHLPVPACMQNGAAQTASALFPAASPMP